MNIFKRGMVSLKRQFVKTIALFFIVLLLGSLTASAISVSRAVQTTEVNLRRRIPAVATVIHDNERILEDIALYGDDALPGWEGSLSSEMIEAIGNLPYVRAFDYAIMSLYFYNQELMLPMNPEPYLGIDHAVEGVILENLAWSSNPLGLNHLLVKGVYHPNVLDIEEGLIELVEGRVFRSEEMDQAMPVALVSQDFADLNHLSIGSTFIANQRIPNVLNISKDMSFEELFHRDNLLIFNPMTVEVIGIFTPTMVMDNNVSGFDMMNHMDLNNRIYVPLEVAKAPWNLLIDYVREEFPERLPEFYFFEYEDVVFALYDPLYLDPFREAASEIIPDFWLMDDLTHVFAPISTAMEIMQQISDWIVIGMMLSSLAILGLLITLFLRDRKYEMGVYLALGSSKRNIVYQMLIEVIVVSIFAVTISLFIGNLLAGQLSQTMLRENVVRNAQLVRSSAIGGHNDFNQMGFSLEMTPEEMLDAYSVSLDGTVVLIFFSLSLGMILLSTLIPTLYLIRLEPKKVLL